MGVVISYIIFVAIRFVYIQARIAQPPPSPSSPRPPVDTGTIDPVSRPAYSTRVIGSPLSDAIGLVCSIVMALVGVILAAGIVSLLILNR